MKDEEIKFVPVKMSEKDKEFLTLREETERAIVEAFGVTKEQLEFRQIVERDVDRRRKEKS